MRLQAPREDLIASVHGDFFTTLGPKLSLDWFRQQLELKHELKQAYRLWPRKDDDKEGRVLNRFARWTEAGLVYECDPRHLEKLFLELGLTGSKPVCTPGVKPSMDQPNADEAIPDNKVTHIRGLAARSIFLSADKPDCQFSAKDVCRFLAKPTKLSVERFKRLGRYLSGQKRLVKMRRWQDQVDTMACTLTRGTPGAGEPGSTRLEGARFWAPTC